jgi:hypothetical protein
VGWRRPRLAAFAGEKRFGKRASINPSGGWHPMAEEKNTGPAGKPEETFGLSDVPIYTGVARPELEKWMKLGWVRPSVEAGKTPLFTRVDLYHIAFLRKVKESGFSRDLAVEKINVHAICRAWDSCPTANTVGIAFSRTQEGGSGSQGAWIISETLDQETGWDSLNLIGDRMKEGTDDFYILNFTRLAKRIDDLIAQAAAG